MMEKLDALQLQRKAAEIRAGVVRMIYRAKGGHIGGALSSVDGLAFMAGFATGFWRSKEELTVFRRPDRTFARQMEDGERERLYLGWKEAVKRTLSTSNM